MYDEGGRPSNGGVAVGCRSTARDAGARAPLHPRARRLAHQPPAAGAVLTVRRQAQNALAEVERRRATSTTPGAGGDGSRARSREAAAATAGEGTQVKTALAASASSVGSAATTVSAASSAAVGLMGAQGLAASPPPPTSGPASLLYAQLSSSVSSSSLNLDELTLAVAVAAQQQGYDDEDPMSPQSVFPRVRQKLREEASSLSGTGTGGGTGSSASGGSAAAGIGIGIGIDAADPSADYVPLSSPVAAAAAAAAATATTAATSAKKRSGRQLPEIPQSVRCRTPPLVALSASADSTNRLSFPYDDDGCSVHELSGGGGGGGSSSSSNGGTPRSQISHGQGAGAGLPLFHRTAPAAVYPVAPSPGSGSNSYGSSSIGSSSGSSLVLGASVAAAAASAAAGASGGLSVITPLPPWAIQKSSLYELRAAFQELSRALAQMEVAAGKRARVRSEAYIIKFEHEFADLARVKDRAVKRLEALLRAGPGGAPAFAPDSAHAQALGAVLRAVLDIDDELLLLMGTEHGTWEELKRVRGEMQRHLLLLGQELRDGGDSAVADAVGAGAGVDPLGPVPMFRSLSSPACVGSNAGSRCGGSVFSFAPTAVAASVSSACSASTAAATSLSGGSSNSKRKAGGSRSRGHGVREHHSGSPTEEDVFKLRPLEASLSSLGSSASSSGVGVNGCGPLSGTTSSAGSGGSGGKEDRLTQQQQQPQQQQQRRRRPVQLQPHLHLQQQQPQQQGQPGAAGDGAQGRDPESPGTMTTASLSSSTSSAFSQLSECASDEERSVSGGSAFKQQLSASAAAAAAAAPSSSSRLSGPPMTSMSKSISSDALSGLLLNPPLPAALTAKVREKASFLHHRTLGNNKPLLEAAAALSDSGATNGTGGSGPTRPRYHTTVVSRAGGLGAGRAVPPAAAVEAVAKS